MAKKYTYADLKKELDAMSPRELKQPVTIYDDGMDEYHGLNDPHPTLVSMDGKDTLFLVIRANG